MKTDSLPKLKRTCPCCGCSEIRLGDGVELVDGEYSAYAQCSGCGLRGPEDDSVDLSETPWAAQARQEAKRQRREENRQRSIEGQQRALAKLTGAQ